METSGQAINLATIGFPTDRLTISDLRRISPFCFDLPSLRDYHGELIPPLGRASLEVCVGSTLDAEREVAIRTFRAAVGLPEAEYYLCELEDTIELLALDYSSLGLATGEHHARELVRGIERQATEQARTWSVRVP